ncbi:MAG: outer membrane beta-barrel protein [Rudaea sp.]
MVAALVGLGLAGGALAAERPAPAAAHATGFYGGVALRNDGTETSGINLKHLASTWGRFASPLVSDDGARRALVFGGYRFANDLAVEGSLSSIDSYAQPLAAGTGRGVGLSLTGAPDLATHMYNADVYTSWSFRKSFALYGRLGYAQSEAPPTYAISALPPGEARLTRDGVNYGVGVRYDVSPALGLRLEYARFPRFAGESITGPLPESDQVQLGMQFRF